MPEFILDHGTAEGARAFKALDSFTQGYVTCMFFTDTGDADDEEDGLMSASFAELAPDTLAMIVADCAEFQRKAGDIDYDAARKRVAPDDLAAENAGRDFWYTRNGHGCGFWDGDWHEPFAAQLDTIAKSFREVSLIRGDDEMIYLE